MCLICLLREAELRSNGTDASVSQSGPMPMNSRTSRLSRMVSSIKNAFSSIAQFARDTRPSIPSFVTEKNLTPTLVNGFIDIPNSKKSNNFIIDTTNPDFTPTAARRYIDLFCKHTHPGVAMVSVQGRFFRLNELDDHEAVVIALELLRLETNASMEAVYQAGRNA